MIELKSFAQMLLNNKDCDKIALVDKYGQVTYQELLELSYKVCSFSKKTIKNKNVVVVQPRSIQYVATVLGLNLAGFTVIPLTYDYTKDRISYIKNIVNCDFVFDSYFYNKCLEDQETDAIEVEKNNDPFIMFTSGSTGNPKGVIYSQDAVESLFERLEDCLDFITSDYIVCKTASFSFCASFVDLYFPLLKGATVHIIGDDVKKDIDLFENYLDSNKINFTFIIPSLLKKMNKPLPYMKNIITAGEKVTNIEPKSYNILVMYGMTETLSSATFFILDKKYANTPIGKPLKGINLYLLDESNNISDVGEICLSGKLASGYYNNEEETKKVFQKNPFSNDGNDILIHTSDIGKLDEFGNVIFLNRKDWMVKINGNRVEVLEVEEKIKVLKDIKEAVVKSFVNEYDQTYLCAYYVSDKEIDIKNELSNVLPDYMIPTFIVKVDGFQYNANGKIDRNILEKPSIRLYQTKYEKPINEIEKAVCRAFEEIFKIKPIGRNDDFFSLGGDSIQVLTLTSKLSQYTINSSIVFNGKTPKNISSMISKVESFDEVLDNNLSKYPLTSAQLGIYYACINNPESTMYNIPFYLELPNTIQLEKLQKAINEVVNYYSCFKASFEVIDSEVCLLKKDSRAFIDSISTDKSIDEILKDFVKPFDFTKELARFVIVNTNKNKYLLCDIHHLIFDGSSLTILLNTISKAYNNLINFNDLELNEKLSIFDISLLEEKERKTEKYQEAKKFFNELLSENDFLDAMDIDNQPLNNVKYEESSIIVKETLNDVVDSLELDNFTSNNSITVSTFFMGCFAWAFSKCLVQDGCNFVTVNSGRHNNNLDSTIGMLVRTTPISIRIDEENTPYEFLHSLSKLYYQVIDNDIYPFLNLSKECNITNDTMFVYQNDLLNNYFIDNQKVKVNVIDNNDSLSKLNVQVFKKENSYELKIQYRSDLYSKTLINAFILLFKSAIKGLLQNKKLKEFQIIDEEYFALIEKLNNKKCDTTNKFDNVCDMLQDAFIKNQDRLSVVTLDYAMSYKELDEITNRISKELIKRGIKKGDAVAILTSRDQFMAILPIAVIRAGGLYVPLDNTYPKDRLNFMVKDSNARLLISSRVLRDVIDNNIDTLYIDDIYAIEDDNIVLPKIEPLDPFVMLYTSGSTGFPKGCIINHHNIINFLNYFHSEFEFTNESKMTSYASFGFDANIMETFTTLSKGACLYIIPLDMRLELDRLDEYIQKCDVTHLFMTTQVGRQYATTYRNKHLKYLITGGEALVSLDPPTDYKLINAYGPTEATVFVTCFHCDRFYTKIPIGKIGPNLEAYVVDKYMRLLPFGIGGELCVSGGQVTNGYFNRDEVTNEVFIDNPFSKDSRYSKMYRTKDIVKMEEDGVIHFVGRSDSQVKIRGFRIELTEVEEVIRRFKGIKDCTVVALNDLNNNKYIASYVVSDEVINVNELNDFIRSEKPSYMVPKITIQIDSIPLTQNHKVNKKALPKIDSFLLEVKKPTTEAQERLFNTISDVIGYKDFGVDCDLYDAGLSSITSIKLIAVLSKEYNRNITIKDITLYNTIEKLEEFLINEFTEVNFKKQDIYPLSKNQEGIFFECLSKLDSTFYNIPYLIKLGDVDINKLKISIVKVINCHPYVLSHFKMDSTGVKCLRVDEKYQLDDILCIDLSKISKKLYDLDILKEVFPLENSRLFRITFIKDNDSNYLFFNFHHLIFDGTSLSVLMDEIDKCYQDIEVKEEEYSTYEFCLDELNKRESSQFEECSEYYKKLLDDDLSVSLPNGDYPNDEKVSNFIYTIKDININKLNEYCKHNKVSKNSLFTSAFGYLLSRYQNDEQSLFTTVYNGRDDSRFNRSLGMFVKTYPVRCDIVNNVSEYIKGINNQLINSRNNSLYSFQEINKTYNITSDILFVFQDEGFEHNTFCLKPYIDCSLNLDINSRKAILTLTITLKGNDVDVFIDYDNSIYSYDYMQSFAKTYELILKQIINEVNDFNSFRLVDDSTIELLETFHGKDLDFKYNTINEYLEENFKNHGDLLAIVDEETSITYHELDRLSSNIAKYLIEKGVTNQDIVAVMASRDIYMGLCPVGVIRSGAMYQPLDSTYPKERLNFMINDSKAKILITPKSLRNLIDSDIETLYVEDIMDLPDCDLNLPRLSANNPFVILYTSGSTGLPKGCILEHINFVAFCNYLKKEFEIEKTSNYATYASFGFDASVGDVFTTLLASATLYIVPLEIRLDLFKLNDYFIRNNITHAFMTTQIARQFATTISNHTLKYLLSGGETLISLTPPENFVLVNGYGPTETSCGVSFFKVDRLYHSIPIGKINDNMKAYVVDKNHQRVGVNVPGELWVSGVQVSRGYLNRDEKTKEVFIDNPFSDDPKYRRLYRTGDVVAFLNDGTLQFIGRKDSQVKIRGFRVELTEIEEVIRRFDNIKDCTVVAIDEGNEKFIASYIVSDEVIDIDMLIDFIRNEKPSYMVPKAFMQIDKIPLTQNQKVNKKALPKIDIIKTKKYVKPETKIEKDICDIFGEVLSVNEYSVEDDFFLSGGSSILATKVLVNLIAKGYQVSYADLFLYQTPRRLAHFLDSTPDDRIIEFNDYDYTSINKLIKGANINKVDELIEEDETRLKGNMKNILLPGCTGFLGIHILKTFLENYDGVAYCMIRSNKELSPEEKLKTMLIYYFDNEYEEMFENGRIQCVETSLDDPKLEEKLDNYDFDTIINCAAIVKHFVSDDSIYKVNTEGVKRLLKICKDKNKRFIQTSTYSVGGFVTAELNDRKLSENDLYIGQITDNDYINSKFLAEREVLEYALQGVDCKIVRLGNLMSRIEDGEFQINFVTSGFMRDIRGVTALGYAPIERFIRFVEFSPIDSTAQCVLKISDSNLNVYIYHPYNYYAIRTSDLIDVCIESGFNIKIVNEKEYHNKINEAIEKYKDNSYMSDIIGGLIAYKNAKNNMETKIVDPTNNLTSQILDRLDFKWPMVEKRYVMNCIDNLKKLGFFDLDFSNKK